MRAQSWSSWLALMLALVSAPLLAEEKKETEKPKEDIFLRVQRDDKKEPIALQTSVVHFVAAGEKNAGIKVDLIGAVHVGDKQYYGELNKLFESYEALLYELVAPEGTTIPKGGARTTNNPLTGMQRGMQTMLDLEFQLDCVDYTKKNFVHADMSPEDFSKSMKEKDESMLTMMFRMMGQGAKMQASGKNSDAEMLYAMFASDRPYRLKKAMASQFENMEGQMAALEGKDGSTIITERNKKALAVLKREIDDGKKKSFGIFYGAGHLSDMQARLIKDFGMKKESERWLTAWKIEKPAKKPAAKTTNKKPEVEEAAK